MRANKSSPIAKVNPQSLLTHDPNFMHEVANTLRGRGILACIQCGRCSSSCAIGRIVAKHNPRRLMEMIILGLRGKVLLTDLPWFCASCFTCLDRCPQGGDVGEVMFAIRNLAAKEGNVPAGIVNQVKNLVQTGRIVNVTESIKRQRKQLGLPENPLPAIAEIQKIMRRTGLTKIAGLK